jgi:hypothetical protein
MKSLGKVAFFGLLAAATGLSAAPDSTGGGSLELTARVTTVRTQAAQDLQHVYHLQQLARREKDVIKLNCINDKLVLMKAQNNVIDGVAIDISGEADGTALFAKLEAAGQNVRSLRDEADHCSGEPLLSGEQSNGFTGPTVIDNPFVDVLAGTGGIEPPGYASPFD